MAIILKSPGEIEAMKAACVLSAQVLREVGAHCKPGVTTLELDEIAETFIREHGGFGHAQLERQPVRHEKAHDAACDDVGERLDKRAGQRGDEALKRPQDAVARRRPQNA